MDNGASSYRRFLAGDREGLAEIVREYSDGLILYINSFVQNICVSEEIAEDVFVEIALKKPRYSEKSSFKTWLYAVARHTAIDCIKRYSRISDIPVDEIDISCVDLEMVDSVTFSEKASAVMAIIGIFLAQGLSSLRIALVASSPFISGI